MATRFRLPSAGAAPVSPAFQAYTHANGTRGPLVASDASALSTVAQNPDAADHAGAGDTSHKQFVSAPLAAGIVFNIGDAIKYAIQSFEESLFNDQFLQLFVSVVSNDGSAVLATLRSKVADDVELSNALTNRTFTGTLSGAYTTVGGERLVVEFSAAGTPATGNLGNQGHNATMRWGSDGASGDLPEDDTTTAATFNPWIEFVQNIAFQSAIGAFSGRRRRHRLY